MVLEVCGPNLTTKISKSEIFEFSKLSPERSWGIAGMVGRAETCSKDTAARPRASRPASLHRLHDVVVAEHGNGKEFQIPRNLRILNILNSSKARNSKTHKIHKLRNPQKIDSKIAKKSLLLGGCGVSRAWLGMRKRVLNTRPHASCSAPSPFMTAE